MTGAASYPLSLSLPLSYYGLAGAPTRESATSDSAPELPPAFGRPHPAQERLLAQADRYNVGVCGRRLGKTTLAKRLLASVALSGRPVCYAPPIYPMAHQFYRDLEAELGAYVVRREANRRLDLVGGGYIDFWSLDNGGARMRGQKYARVVADECQDVLGLMGIWERVIRPTLTDYAGDMWFLGTPRRGGDFERLYQMGQAGRDGWAGHHIPTAITEDGTARSTVVGTNNPWLAAPLPDGSPDVAAVIAELEAARTSGMSSQAFATEYLADFEASDSALVYPEFSRALHVRPARVPWSQCKWRLAGIDPGGGDPTALYLLGVDEQEHMHVYAPEFYRRGDVTVDMLAEFLARADKAGHVQRIVVGETGGNVVTNTLRRLGFPAVKAEMAKGEGLEHVRWALQHRVLTIDPGCEEMITEFGLYRWALKRDPVEGDRYATHMPGGRHGDAMDALRYIVMAVINSLRAARPAVIEQRRGMVRGV